MSISSQHHSFDIALATQFSIEEAIIIHHFQHWIRINRMNKRNIKEGRAWTYQTRKEIADHFPYFSVDQIRRICEKLVEKGVLLQANYNKKGFDKTLWYAFANEIEFGVDEASIQKMFTIGKSAHVCGRTPAEGGEIGKPIPDTKNTDTKTDIPKEEPRGASPPAPPPASEGEPLFQRDQVKMPITDFNRLARQYGLNALESIILDMNLYAQASPRKFKAYANHASVAESWLRKELKKGNPSWKNKNPYPPQSINSNQGLSVEGTPEHKSITQDSWNQMLKKWPTG